MDEKTLLRFIREILVSADGENCASSVLSELYEILSLQGAPDALLEILQDAMNGLPEAMKMQEQSSGPLSPSQLKEARTQAARRREMEMRSRGRC